MYQISEVKVSTIIHVATMHLPLAISYADSASLGHSGRAQCPKSSPTFFLSLQMLHNFESQSQILPLPGSPPDQTGFALCWTAKPFPVLSMCVHSIWPPPPFLGFSRGSKLQDQFHISMTSDKGRDAEWWIHCYIEGDTRMNEIISLGFL